jgi:hypothetical protein
MIANGVIPDATTAACRSAVALLGEPLGRPDLGRFATAHFVAFDYF